MSSSDTTGKNGEQMAYKFPSEKFQKLESEDRYEQLRPAERLQAAGMNPGDHVLDAGCGTGFYARSAGEVVGESGHVVGIDILEEMLEKADEFGLPDNVECVQSQESKFPVDESSMDWVIMTNLYHELEDPDAFIAEIRRVLTSGGKVNYLDWIPQEEEDGPPAEHRIDKSVPIAAFESAGFRWLHEATVGPSHFELIFEVNE